MVGLALLSTVAFTGCGRDGDDRGFGPDNPGSFTANVTGDVTANLSGIAAFAVFDDGTTEVFEVALMAGTFANGTDAITFVREGSRRAGNGTYSIGVAAGNMRGTLHVLATSATFTFTSGSVTITSSRENGVSGHFTVGGEDTSGNTISITGSFSAECNSDDYLHLTCG